MRSLRMLIPLSVFLVWLLSDLSPQAVPAAYSNSGLPNLTLRLEANLELGRLNSPELASSVTVTETNKLFAETGVFQDMLGTAIAMEGDTVAAGAPQAICALGDPCLPGSASIFSQTLTGEWSEQKIAPYDGHINDFFGEAIALSGDILVVGANEGAGSSDQGSIYIYRRSQGTPGGWEIVTKWKPTDPHDFLFGWSVAVSGDTVVVGAPTYFWEGFTSAAYLFERNHGGANSWGLVKRWAPVGTPPVIAFGMSASIDGDTLVVGARHEVYVYERDLGGPGAWGQRQQIVAPEDASHCFGFASSVQGDTLVIGDECNITTQGPYGHLAKGAAYIYFRNPNSRQWSLWRKLLPSNSDAERWTGYFGSGVSIDGDTIVVGAPYVKVGANDRQGAAYLFCRNQGGANQWGEVAQLVASDGAAYDYFGRSVATQGGKVVVGSPYANINGDRLQGAAYLYAGCKQPLVFIPGIAGSRMVDRADGNKEIWPGKLVPDLIKLSLFTSDHPSPAVTPFEPILKLPIFGSSVYQTILEALKQQGDYREYLVDGDLSRQTLAGCQEQLSSQQANHPDLFVFTYDWRLSIDVIADRLKEYIGCVEMFYPNTRVNVLAHSMGGLVARRYMSDNPGTHNINALITVGSPFLGAPKMPFVLETGEFYEQPAVNTLRAAMTKYISGSFTSAHQLAPSAAWFTLGGDPLIGEAGYDLDNDGRLYEFYDYDRYIWLLDSRYGFDQNHNHQFQPGTATGAFHTLQQDDWSGDPPGILYHHIYGIKDRESTINQIIFHQDPRCYQDDSRSHLICPILPPVAVPSFTSGDGTVPVLSAKRIGNGKNYNAPGARLYPILNMDEDLASHVGMLNNKEVIKLILEILHDPTYSPAPLSMDQTAQAAALGVKPAHYLTIKGGETVIVRDAFGHDSGTAAGNDLWRKPVPGVDLYVLGENAYMAVLPPGETFTVTFTAVGEPLAIELRTGTGSTTAQLTRYLDLELPDGVAAQLQVTSQDVAALSVDLDGDGVYETSVPHTTIASGTSDLDMDPPEVRINDTNRHGTTQVAITATDSGSGVKAVFYSLDGLSFFPYTGPVEIQGCRSFAVYSFAEDMLSNRSGLIERAIPCDTLIYLPVITH